MPPVVKRLAIPALIVLAAGAAAYGARMGWRAKQPREIGVCVYTDPTFRQRPKWEELLATRFREANRIFQDTKVQWKIVSDGANDPTSTYAGLDRRRAALDDRALCQADVVVSVTGQMEGKRGGSVSPFSRTAIVVDQSDKSEAENAWMLAHTLAYLFAAPTEPAGAGTVMTEPPESDVLSAKTIGLIREVRGYNFAAGIDGLTPEWEKRVVSAIEAAAPGTSTKPSVQARRIMSVALANEHKTERAAPYLREAVKIDPGNASLRAELAGILAQISEGLEAKKEMIEAIRLDPNNPILHAQYAGLLTQQGEPDDGIEEINKAIELAPNNAVFHLSRGAILVQIPGAADEAIASYQTAIRVNADIPAARLGLERAEAVKKKAQEDVVQQRQRTQQAASNPTEQFNLGIAEMRAGNLDASTKALEKSAELAPTAGRTQVNLALVRYKRGDYTGAWKAIKAARAANFEPPAALVTALKRKQPE